MTSSPVTGSVNNIAGGLHSSGTGSDGPPGGKPGYNALMCSTFRIATALFCASRRRAGALLLALGLTSAGCQDSGPDAALAQYLSRLVRTLDVAAPAVNHTPLPLPPRPGELRLPAATGSLDALDFLALTGCAVQVTIGKRNSSLGRTAAASQRLLLELEYLRLAPECIAFQRSSGRGSLADQLEAAWRSKRERLPAMIFNATLGGAEYRRFWRPDSAPGDYPTVTGGGVIDALKAINALARRWLAGDYRADNLEFEIYLGEVATGDGGALLQALAGQGAWLAAADTALTRREQIGPLCAPGTRHDAANIMPGVVRRFFIGRVQPHSAALGSRYHRLLPPVRELEHMLAGALPPAFLDWQARRDTLLTQLAGAPRRHVQRLQSIMAPCGGLVVRD